MPRWGQNGTSAPCHCQPTASIAINARYARFVVAQAGQRGDPDVKTAGNLANVG
jgi:hypothetical protein